jgi:ATP-dependent Lon protease
MLPARNKKDLEEIPESARKQLKFVWLETIDDALNAALETRGRAAKEGGKAAAA